MDGRGGKKENHKKKLIPETLIRKVCGGLEEGKNEHKPRLFVYRRCIPVRDVHRQQKRLGFKPLCRGGASLGRTEGLEPPLLHLSRARTHAHTHTSDVTARPPHFLPSFPLFSLSLVSFLFSFVLSELSAPNHSREFEPKAANQDAGARMGSR